jgi:hypothetical protein
MDKHLATGTIQSSKSPQTSPFFFVPKKDGLVHSCPDYRYVNFHTVKNAYPLPLISDLVDCLQGSCVFTKMDIRWGYRHNMSHFHNITNVSFNDRNKFQDIRRVCNELNVFPPLRSLISRTSIHHTQQILYTAQNVLTYQADPAGYALLQCIASYLRYHQYILLDIHMEQTLKEGEAELLVFQDLLDVSRFIIYD